MDKVELEFNNFEQKFCDNNTSKKLKLASGELITIHSGLPRENFAGMGVVTVPKEPHVFDVDTFEIASPEQKFLEAQNVRVMYLHGQTNSGRWVSEAGYSIPDMVKTYEEETGERIDAILVCNPESDSKVKIIPFSDNQEKARIYQKYGNAQVGVQIKDNGEVNAWLWAVNGEDIEYLSWKNRPKVKINVI